MFAYAIDEARGLAVMLFTGAVVEGDLWACARALAEFDARVTTKETPAVVLVDKSREQASGGRLPKERRKPLHQAKATTLLAVVTSPKRGSLDAVAWICGERYVPFPATTFEEAMTWIEERREAALFPFFEHLLADVLSATGPETERDG